MDGIDIQDKTVLEDGHAKALIALRAKNEKLQRENAALKKDRHDLLQEYADLQAAKYPVTKTSPAKQIKTGDFVRVICNDVHGALMEREAVNAFLDDLAMWNPDEIVLNGDIIDCGGFLAAHHTMGYIAQSSYTYQDDVAATNWFLDELQARAPKAVIHFIEGNHDARPERWIMDQKIKNNRDAEFLMSLVSPRSLLNLQDRGITYYERSKTHVKGLPPGWIKLGKVLFVHELGASVNAARQALGKTAANVVFAHSHREDSATMNLPGVGLVKAWNPGCLCRLQELYMHSNPSSWSHGYAVQLVSKGGTFLHLNIPIWQGRSLVGNLHGMIGEK